MRRAWAAPPRRTPWRRAPRCRDVVVAHIGVVRHLARRRRGHFVRAAAAPAVMRHHFLEDRIQHLGAEPALVRALEQGPQLRAPPARAVVRRLHGRVTLLPGPLRRRLPLSRGSRLPHRAPLLQTALLGLHRGQSHAHRAAKRCPEAPNPSENELIFIFFSETLCFTTARSRPT